MAKPIFILNGPNLNLLGLREPEVYGTQTLADIENLCAKHAQKLNFTIDMRQSNHEGQLIDWIQEARDAASAVIINAAALSHSSIGLLDALRACDVPVIEVHLSNIYSRETYRHHSYISAVAHGVICGFGATGYKMALTATADILTPNNKPGGTT